MIYIIQPHPGMSQAHLTPFIYKVRFLGAPSCSCYSPAPPPSCPCLMTLCGLQHPPPQGCDCVWIIKYWWSHLSRTRCQDSATPGPKSGISFSLIGWKPEAPQDYTQGKMGCPEGKSRCNHQKIWGDEGPGKQLVSLPCIHRFGGGGCSLFYIKMGSLYYRLDSNFTILLPQPPECWN